MTEGETPFLEYNLAGGLVFTVRERDFGLLCQGIIEAGYGHACVLPFRALTKEKGLETLQNSPLTVAHIEEAWNPTNEDDLTKAVLAGLIGNLKRRLGDKTEPPILQDAFFPSGLTCEQLFKRLMVSFPQAKFISHQIEVDFPSDRLLVEINSGIKLTASELLDLTEEKGIGLVFDPQHLLISSKTISSPSEPTRRLRGEWERQFRIFKENLEVVDIHAQSEKDVQDLLKGRGILKELALAARENEVEFLRVEIPIPKKDQIIGKDKGFEFLRRVGQKLKEE